MSSLHSADQEKVKVEHTELYAGADGGSGDILVEADTAADKRLVRKIDKKVSRVI